MTQTILHADDSRTQPGLPTVNVAGASTAPFAYSADGTGQNWRSDHTRSTADLNNGSHRTPSQENRLLPWSVFAYGGKWSNNRFVQLLGGSTKLRDSQIWVVGVSRTLDRFYDHLILEAEANIGVHSGLQDHLEVNVSPNLRWTYFPWDEYVDTTFATGFGGSFATEKPEVETLPDKDRDASRYLFFLMTEVTFELWSSSSASWEGFVRIHHRSGGFETIIDAEGSNFVSLGVRYRFGG